MRWPWSKAETEDEFLDRMSAERQYAEARANVEEGLRKSRERERQRLVEEGRMR